MLKGLSKGIYLPYRLESSKAFLSLTGKAPHVLLLFMRRRRIAKGGRKKGKEFFVITNNGKIEFPYIQAKCLGISEQQFRRALDQLVDRGFLSVEHTGGAYQRDKSLYSLIDNWELYPTSDFKKGKKRKKGQVRRGYQRRSG